MPFTAIQKQVFGSWNSRLRAYLANHWRSLLTGGLAGSIINIIGHILLRDSTFKAMAVGKWKDGSAHVKLDGLSTYKAELLIVGAFIGALGITWLSPRLRRVFRSWRAGIVSATFLIAGATTLALLKWPGYAPRIVVLCVLSVIIEFVVQLWPDMKSNAPPQSNPLPKNPASSEKSAVVISDAPIESWEFDILNRGAVVESLVERVLVSKAPVVALHGEYGDGKSSVLNLTKLAIGDRAIVVPFSAWLPGSQETLTTNLFGDVAKACRQKFYVPQLRKRTLAYARTLSGSVPHLGGLKELIPAESQAQEIISLSTIFRRLPIPVVVLIDEADRMHSEEIFVLLKILRGTASMRNVRFVCAFNRAQFESQVRKANEVPHDFFEKFFPLTISLPPVDSDLLRKLFLRGIRSNFADGWIIKTAEKKEFEESLERLWDDDLTQLCTNLRKLTLILNDLETAARPVIGEVHPFDLLVIEVIRRSYPELYALLWKNGEFVTLSPGMMSSKRSYRTETRQKAESKKFWEIVESTLSTSINPKVGSAMLHWLFPAYHDVAKSDIAWYQRQHLGNRDEIEQQKRICHPDFFPIYFRYSVPETMFSDAERNALVKAINESKEPQRIQEIFNRTFDEIVPKSPKRYNFLYKLSRSIDLIAEPASPALAQAVALRAADYLYELFGAVGEAARGINIVLEVAEKLSKTSQAQSVLENAIKVATDDTFAYRILKLIKEKDENEILRNYANIGTERIVLAFIARMNARYGPSVDVETIDIQFGDHFAFTEWVSYSEDERQNEIAFWRRYIGQSRKRLAQALNFIYPGGYSWTNDPSETINKLFPVDEASVLLNNLRNDEALNETESKALERFAQLLRGEYSGKNGPGVGA